jgi:hypothetical protein
MAVAIGCRVVKWVGAFMMVALVLAPAGAEAKPRPKLVLGLATPLQSDARRYLTYSQDGSQLVIRDTSTNKQREIALGPGCAVKDGMRGFFLINCSTPAGDETPYVLIARTGALVQPPGFGQTYFPFSDIFSTIGTQWLGGVNDLEGRVGLEYINWHTGRIVGTADEPGDPTVPRDLNSVSLSALGPAGEYQVFQRLGAVAVSVSAAQPRDPLVLRVRGHKRVILDQCLSQCSSVTLGPKVTTWGTNQRAHAYVLKTHHRLAWKFGGLLTTPDVEQTAKRIYVNVQNGYEPSSGYRVFSIPLPH